MQELIIVRDQNPETMKKAKALETSNSLNFEKWQETKEVFPDVVEWRTTWLRIDKIPQAIFKPIEHIRFPELSVIQLNHTYLESIESLMRIELPSLIRIYLYSNLITSIREVRKSDWRRINIFSINDCRLQNADSFVYLPSAKLTTIRLDYSSDNEQVSSFSFVAKMKTAFIEQLRIDNTSRIPCRQIRQSLKKKYLNWNDYT